MIWTCKIHRPLSDQRVTSSSLKATVNYQILTMSSRCCISRGELRLLDKRKVRSSGFDLETAAVV